MSEIPERIRETARTVCRDIYGGFTPPEHVETIARALLAERERCAKIADEWEPISVLLPLCDAQTNEAAVVAQVETGERIAAAIR